MREERYISILKKIALLGGIDREIVLSSYELSKIINCSQQSASRYLIEMEKMNLITRKLGVKKQRIRITEKGKKLLEKEYLDYRRIFIRKKEIILKGKVTSGLGEGKYYTSIDGYIEQFVEKLGFKPVPGTLNIKILEDYMDEFKQLLNERGIEVEGFSTENRTFGGARCFFVEISSKEAVAIIPLRSHYSDILELIAPYNLREKLNLKDGDIVEIRVKREMER